MRDDAASTVAELVSEIRAGVQLRDGYYLREELVDLYLVGVLRGMEAGLREMKVEPEQEEAQQRRIDELGQTAAELLRNLHARRAAGS